MHKSQNVKATLNSIRPKLSESIILEDLERVFEDGGEESKLSNSVLKLCLSHAPCRDCHSQMSGWLMAGRLAAIELHHVADHQVRLHLRL